MKIKIRHTGPNEIAIRKDGDAAKEDLDLYRRLARDACDMRWNHPTREYAGPIDRVARIFDFAVSHQWTLGLDDPQGFAEALQAAIVDIEDNVSAKHTSALLAKLFPYQLEGRNFLASRKTGLLADQMGLGKTIQAIASIPNYSGKIAPTIVLCPASLRGVWTREIKQWRQDILGDVDQVFSISSSAMYVPPAPGEIVVASYGVIPERDDYIDDPDLIPLDGTVLIMDEIHACKEPGAKRTKKARTLGDFVRQRGGRVWGLSGTPLLNREAELWEVLKTTGAHEEAFSGEDEYFVMFGRGPNHPLHKEGDAFKDRLARVMLRRERADVLPDLPTKTYETIEAPDISPEVAKICDEALGDGAVLKALEQLAEAEKADFMSLGVIARARAALATAKLPLAKKTAEYFLEEGEPVVFFSAHRDVIDILARMPGFGKIVGGMSSEAKACVQDDFQAGKLKAVALTIGAGSEGLTLTRAHRAVFIDRMWTPMRNQQAEDRVCRIGQDRGVIITDLVADHILDHMIYEACVKKQRLFDKSVGQLAKVERKGATAISAGDATSMLASLRDVHSKICHAYGLAPSPTLPLPNPNAIDQAASA